MAKTKLSVSLIKEQFVNDEDILKSLQNHIDLGNTHKLYYKNDNQYSLKWVASFFGNDEHLARLKGRSVSAVILYRIEVEAGVERVFALCFGFGRNLLKQDVLERRFGLLVTLNSIDEKNSTVQVGIFYGFWG